MDLAHSAIHDKCSGVPELPTKWHPLRHTFIPFSILTNRSITRTASEKTTDSGLWRWNGIGICESAAHPRRRTPQTNHRLPGDLGNVDIILLGSVLQFVEDYKSLLKRLAALNAPYWLFTFVPTGDIPTFASGQKNVPGSTIPVWFFNLDELLEIMKALGYQMIFKAAMER